MRRLVVSVIYLGVASAALASDAGWAGPVYLMATFLVGLLVGPIALILPVLVWAVGGALIATDKSTLDAPITLGGSVLLVVVLAGYYDLIVGAGMLTRFLWLRWRRGHASR